jgi:hypothetical protein
MIGSDPIILLPADPDNLDENVSSAIFLLTFENHENFGIIELSQTGKLSESELETVKFIQGRFRRYGKLAFARLGDVQTAVSVSMVGALPETAAAIDNQLQNVFHCARAEF